jgi:HEAT repeat protein
MRAKFFTFAIIATLAFTVVSADEASECIQTLEGGELNARREAIKELAELNDTAAVTILISALGDENCYIRGDAAWALGEIGDTRAVEPLIEHLQEIHWVVRSICAAALGKIGDRRATEPLITILQSRKTWFTERFTTWNGQRWNAAWALGEIGDERAVDALIAALDDSSARIRKNAAEALGKIDDERAVEPLKKRASRDFNKEVRETASKALQELE